MTLFDRLSRWVFPDGPVWSRTARDLMDGASWQADLIRSQREIRGPSPERLIWSERLLTKAGI